MKDRRDEKKLNKLLKEDLKFKEEILRYYLGDEMVDNLLSSGIDLEDIDVKGKYN